jgi:hypothetical protein
MAVVSNLPQFAASAAQKKELRHYLAKVATEVLGRADVAREGAADFFKKAIPAAYASMADRPSDEAMDQAIGSVTQRKQSLKPVHPEQGLA